MSTKSFEFFAFNFFCGVSWRASQSSPNNINLFNCSGSPSRGLLFQVKTALASSPVGTAQLDLVCAYMKRVYFYLYYRGQQCRDEGDMIASRGAGRGVPAASKEEIEKVAECRKHYKTRISLWIARLVEKLCPRPSTQVRRQ